MRINVLVKTNSKFELVEVKPDGTYLVRVSVSPVDGKANKRVIEMLAKHFNQAKSTIVLVSGVKSKNKVFDI